MRVLTNLFFRGFGIPSRPQMAEKMSWSQLRVGCSCSCCSSSQTRNAVTFVVSMRVVCVRLSVHFFWYGDLLVVLCASHCLCTSETLAFSFGVPLRTFSFVHYLCSAVSTACDVECPAFVLPSVHCLCGDRGRWQQEGIKKLTSSVRACPLCCLAPVVLERCGVRRSVLLVHCGARPL